MCTGLAPFQLTAIGGPWGRRLAPRRAWIDELPWSEELPPSLDARQVWTSTAFSEYASAAAFAEIASLFLAAGAPIDLVAAAGDFVVDEIVHTELAARVAAKLGGAVELEVDLSKLVRPAVAADPLLAAAEVIVRTSCVGEALTVPILKLSRRLAGSELVDAAIATVVADEAHHAQLGWWFLDWASDRLGDGARAHLGRVAGTAIRAFAPMLRDKPCTPSHLGTLGCADYDPAFTTAVEGSVARPLAARGIVVPDDDLAAVGVAPPGDSLS